MSDETVHPYVGIRPFNSDENLFFFGRDEQTLEILQRLHENHFVAVVGGSGSGKSSLIRAGLIPALKGGYLVEDSHKWLIAIMKPGQNPMYNLAKAILFQVNPEITHTEILDFVIRLKKEGVKAIIQLIAPLQKEENINFFLLIDQFEEVFRFAMDLKDAARKTEAFDFVNMMLSLATQTETPFYIVLTMRSDFIGDCAQFHELPEALNKSQYLVPRLNRQQLKMVIEGPAKLFGVKFSPALTSQLLNDLGNVKDELPLMQHALMRIWDYEMGVDKSGELDLRDYKAIGGFEKALDIHADEALNSLSEADQGIAKILFQALTEIDDNRRKIRRPLLLKDLKELTGATEDKLLDVIDHFIRDMRAFLILERSGEKGALLIDISHESLIRQWDTLNQWVDEEGESAAAYKKLVEDTRLHKLNKKDLLTGSELQLALEWKEKFNPTAVWANRYSAESFEACMQYLTASEEEQSRIKNLETARKKKLRYMWAAIGVLLIIFTAFSFWSARESKKLEEEARANERRAKILSKKENDPTEALKLAQSAFKTNDTSVVSVKDVESIYHNNIFYKIVANNVDTINSVAFSPDGKKILTGSQDGTAHLRDLEGNTWIFKGHAGAINSVAFSPDTTSTTILTGSSDHTARLWNIEGDSLQTFRGHKGPINSVAFSPDGSTILTGSDDKTAKLWNIEGDSLLQTFGENKGHTGPINSVAFSPDTTSTTVLTGSKDRTARLWQIGKDKPLKNIWHNGPVSAVTFSPDGQSILTGCDDWNARLWDLKGDMPEVVFTGHEGPVTSVAFALDGRTLLTGSKDQTARWWQLKGEMLQNVKGHTGAITSLAFSPDGSSILTGSEDQTARSWNLKVELLQIFKGHRGSVKSVTFSPNGDAVLTGSDDKTAALWNFKGDTIQLFNGKGTAYSVVFSPNGKTILVGSKDGKARLWDVKGKLLRTFEGHKGPIYSVAIDSTGTKILTGSADKTARLWNIEGDSLQTFRGHTGALNSVAFSPDGNTILTGSDDETARLWNIEGDSVQTFRGHKGAINSVAYSPDTTSTKILTGSSDHTARLWNIEGDSLRTFRGHTATVNSVAFSPDGSRILTGSYDMTARLWDTEDGSKTLQLFKGHRSLINSVSFSSDGETILTGSYDRTARLWKVVLPLEEFFKQVDWGEPLSEGQK